MTLKRANFPGLYINLIVCELIYFLFILNLTFFYSRLQNYICKSFSEIFNSILNYNTFFEIRKISGVTPVHKSMWHLLFTQGIKFKTIIKSLFINDLSIHYNIVSYLLFADDLKIFQSISKINYCVDLQASLDADNRCCFVNVCTFT